MLQQSEGSVWQIKKQCKWGAVQTLLGKAESEVLHIWIMAGKILVMQVVLLETLSTNLCSIVLKMSAWDRVCVLVCSYTDLFNPSNVLTHHSVTTINNSITTINNLQTLTDDSVTTISDSSSIIYESITIINDWVAITNNSPTILDIWVTTRNERRKEKRCAVTRVRNGSLELLTGPESLRG